MNRISDLTEHILFPTDRIRLKLHFFKNKARIFLIPFIDKAILIKTLLKGLMYLQLFERRRPNILIYLEALLARTPFHHPTYGDVKEKVRTWTAGYAGERWFDRIWHDYASDEVFRVIPDFAIPAHQMDAVCVFSKFIVIIEIKNIGGVIEMNGMTRQFTRTLHTETMGMRNPDDQLYRHEKKIRQLTNNKIPVIGIVVFTNPSSILKLEAVERRVIHLSGFPFVLDQLIEQYGAYPSFDVPQLCDLLLAHQCPPTAYQSEPITFPLQTGVFCPACSFSKMVYSRDLWRCLNCSNRQQDAHLLALQDYRLLIANSISNQEFRSFTEMESRSNAVKILKRCGYKTVGNHKSLRYLIPEMDLRNKAK